MNVCDAPSNNRYVRRRNPCRCDGCRDAHRIYERDRQRSINRPDGRPPDRLIPADEAVAHVQWLRSHGRGLGIKVIARAAGMPYGHLQRVLAGEHPLIRQSTAERLLAVGCHDATLLDAAPLRRHLRALGRRGWTPTMIARSTGVPAYAIQEIKSGRWRRTNPARMERLLAFRPYLTDSGSPDPDYELPGETPCQPHDTEGTLTL